MGVDGSEDPVPALTGVSGTKRLLPDFGPMVDGKAHRVGVGVCIASRLGRAGRKDAVSVS